MPWRFAGSRAVYPRWRGEHRSSHYFPFFFDGLSPLARGTLKVLKNIGFRTRFIPAGAGNTGVIPIAARNAAVYPRWRGEHDKSLTKNNSTPGLSPLARGTHHYFGKSVIKNRFIPAGAGNTAPLKICTKAIAVYPRWRGEHYFCNAQRYSRIGLSPLARGTLAKQTSGYAWCRFIPAGAGNTRSGGFVLPATPVYPRWRGEHKIHIDKHRVCIGLSPLARGTLYYNRWTRYGARFIPAGAGNTNMGSAVNEIKTVYPRWRGEHEAISKTPAIAAGLSPLARGTPAERMKKQ